MIKCLSKEVQAKLRSGIAIISLQQCVEELVLNSIDAGATCIAVRVDMEACKVLVIDNGSGMDRNDMEQVGNRYFTSKCNTLEDLENLGCYGFRGEALASMASLATLVEISSRSKLSVKTFVKVFKEGSGLELYEAETTRPSSGTTVVVCNFFHGMPVRRKRLDSVLEYDRIRRRVEAISLMHPSVSFTLKNDCTAVMVVQLPKARDTYHRFMQIHGLGRAQKLAEVNFSHGPFRMNGHISREGHYNSSLQFLFVNGRLVLKTRIHKLLNLLLKKVRSDNRANSSPGVSPSLGSPKQRTGQELQALYVINIKCHYSEYDICLEPAKTLIEFKDWDSVMFCVEEGVKVFLTSENLITELSLKDVRDFALANGEGEPVASTSSTEASGTCPVMPCVSREGKTLVSKAVYRRLGDTEQSRGPDDVGDGLNADELKLSDTEYTRDVEHNSGHVSSCTPSPFDSQKNTREEQCDNVHDGIQVSGKLVSPLSGAGLPGQTTGSEGVKKHQYQTCELGRTKGITDEMEHEPYISKAYLVLEGCNEGTSITQKTPFEEECNPCLTKVQLGSVGFIRHVIPQSCTHTEVSAEPVSCGLSSFCPLGPISAQDLFPSCSAAGKESFTSVKQTVGHSHGVTSQQSRGPAFQRQNRLAQVSKRKLSFLEDSYQGLLCDGGFKACPTAESKTFKAKLCPKVALPVQAGSLDMFRRMFGRRTGMQPVSEDVGDGQMDHNVRIVHAGYTSVTEGKHFFSPLEDQPGDSLKANPTQLENSPPSPPVSAGQTAKRSSSQSQGRGVSLSGKLSLLKKLRMEDESSVLVLPFVGVPNMDGSSKSKLPQDGTEEEQLANVLFPSPDHTVVDANANYPGLEIATHSNTSSECTDFGLNQFCKLPLTPKSVPTPIIERNGPMAQTATVSRQGFASHEEVSPGEEVLLDHCTPESVTEAGGPSDWLEHFDDYVGRLVYINRVTGLSKYEGPSEQELQVQCVTDVTTMAVSVISQRGFEYRCYPFQTELVLPFLLRPRAERILSSGLNDRGDHQSASTLSSLYSEWVNPVFVRPPQVALDVTSSQAGGLAVKVHNILYPYRFTKDMIHSMKVISQVDKKFLACLMNTGQQGVREQGNLLVLVDQHAAHERVRLESLVEDSYKADPEVSSQKQLCSSIVAPPLLIDITEEELRLLRSCQPFFRGLGLEMEFVETDGPRALVGKVPVCFVEREASELRHGRQTVTKAIVEEYIRELLELLQSTGRVRGTLPLTVLRVLASQACHGAIKFNDTLSSEECCSLIGSLSACKLPFQCAHGRPSMIPLADLLHLDTDQQQPSKPNLRKLRRMYKAWELYGKK